MINNERQREFIDVVDKKNETNIVLNIKSKDKYEKELFFNRKKKYVLNLYAVCDSSWRFIYFLCEWLNSQHDQRIFAAEDLHKRLDSYFSDDQYLLKDSAYINSSILITLYKSSHTKRSEIRRFNKRLSRIRIDIEHAFEILKDRWKSLTELRIRVQNKKSYIYVIRWIIACVVLHNILLKIQNDWNEDEKWWTAKEENSHDEELRQLHDQQMTTELMKKNHVKELILDYDWVNSHLNSFFISLIEIV